MENIYYLLVFFLFCWYFAYLRKVSEASRRHASNYCKDSGLQFIALARKSTRLTFTKKHGLIFKSIFDVEFSGDGESSSQGELYLVGLKLDKVVLPAYKI